MALFRECNHAERAVNAALDLMAAMTDFNRPREFLRLPRLPARIGIASGAAFIGNVGTYHKMDHTAIGNTVNLAARLQSEAEPGVPCISRGTHELVAHLFAFKPDNPRPVKVKGIEEQHVWDVVARKA